MKRGRTEEWTKWRGLVSEQIASRQTVAAFCRDRGLCDWQFYDWKKRVREGEAAKFVAVKVAAVAKQAPAAAGRAIEVRLPRGRSLVIEPGFDAGHRMRRKIGKVDCLPVLVSERGQRLTPSSTHKTFATLSRAIGLRPPATKNRNGRGPRLQDFRHCFATRRLINWYRGRWSLASRRRKTS